MDFKALWNRYSAIWSSDAARRKDELAACLSVDATYCDPNGAIEGPDALSSYMGGFQEAVPGGSFRILEVVAHNDRSLARWALQGADGKTLQLGASFAVHDRQGRMQSINGFFPLSGQNPGT